MFADLIIKRRENKRMIREKLAESSLKDIENRLKDSTFDLDSYINQTTLGDEYHNLINSKDKIESKYNRKFNQTYHQVDVELYKLNKKIDGDFKLISYSIDNRKQKLLEKVGLQ